MRSTESSTNVQTRTWSQARSLLQTMFRKHSRDLVLVVAMLALAVVFGLTSDEFLTPVNLWNIAAQSTHKLLIAFGMTIIIISGGIDLSVGSVASMVGVLVVWLILNSFLPVSIAMLAVLAIGGLIGAVNGLVVSRLGVPDFMATLGMMSMARGAAFIICGGYAVRSSEPLLAYLYNGQLGPVRVPVIILVFVCLIVHILLSQTQLGRSFYAVGGSRHATRLAGLNVRRLTILAYIIGGTLTALGGLIIASRMAAGSPKIGLGLELEAVAFVILGGANLFGGEGGVFGTLFAGLLVGMITNWMSLTGLVWWSQGFVQGFLLIVVVAIHRRAISRHISEMRRVRQV